MPKRVLTTQPEANAGIPFNIIANTDEAMLNPHILYRSSDLIESMSNCGSLLLPEPIKIYRAKQITFEFWDLSLVRYERTGYYPTIQHEIDHNNGILILDRKVGV